MNRRQFICTAVATLAVSSTQPATASQPVMVVYKDPSCGCCGAWASAMADADIQVDVKDVADLDAVKRKHGVPKTAEGCHTAIIGRYFIEGHVPLEAVVKLRSEAPDILGLAVPGMPVGSLGMGDDPAVASYDVLSVDKTGGTAIYMRVRPISY
ncbi:hypothetical protein AGRO_2064 [Agrobacterium sp. ATCC 31749]|uniref:DUF411 domain-containing protein n=1 Tax=Agrobacterium TaxID=357 RepID=UPI00020DBDC9|nr:MULTISPECIES: DUF411 domain-containing protein [Agrobacterium]EGL65120.1 hypothetical protein AGRO_2064 [Agrobacterium sp. ATCC 31749]MEA1844784.1 DUF411 domain-containing protein [Agrobacterium tumefaciens]QKX00536.1 DUF411 domain-containing protein [Agrobacterium sp. CGMCC 11546]UXT84861.1 DUF411 domain-containing protein [Agrobacterium tumefaciens]